MPVTKVFPRKTFTPAGPEQRAEHHRLSTCIGGIVKVVFEALPLTFHSYHKNKLPVCYLKLRPWRPLG